MRTRPPLFLLDAPSVYWGAFNWDIFTAGMAQVRMHQEVVHTQMLAATRIQKSWRGKRVRSQMQLIDPTSLGHAKKVRPASLKTIAVSCFTLYEKFARDACLGCL